MMRRVLHPSIVFALVSSILTLVIDAPQAIANPPCASGGTCSVGETGPGGGIVFYVDTNGFSCGQFLSSTCNYLEAATNSSIPTWSDPRYTWSGNINTLIGTTSAAIGAGYSNTLKMLSQTGAGTSGAGSAARSYLGGGKNDWYLPSKDELNEMTINQVILGATAGYWSSTETDATHSWDQGPSGIGGNGIKSASTPVRPIRAFGLIAPAPPNPVPFLKTITPPQMHLIAGKLVCSAGKYQSGYTSAGTIIQSSITTVATATYLFILFINGVAQSTLTQTTSSNSAQWDLSVAPKSSTASCSVKVTTDLITKTDDSTENNPGLSAALSALNKNINSANNTFKAAQQANALAYKRTLSSNRTLWRKQMETMRTTYNDTLVRINVAGGQNIFAEISMALKAKSETGQKLTADYLNSQSAALAAKTAANKSALNAKDAEIAKASSAYASFIDSIGYGVLIQN